MGSKCRLAYIPLGHPAINQGAKNTHSTHRYPAPGPAGGQNQAKIPPSKSLKRRLKRHLPNDL